jgi:hypothetical protein
MDEERDRKRTVEVVDTSDQPAEGGPVVRETGEENKARMNPPGTTQEDLVPLFENEATDKFRTRWLTIQSKFVDDPRDAVKQADDLVDEVIQDITRNFADRRGAMEQKWNGGGEASTEDLRQALRQYRSFFDRLLSLQS